LIGARVRALGPRALAFSGACWRTLGPRALASFGGRRLACERALMGLGAWAVVVLVPSVSAACAVCTAGRDEENQMAFLLSTLGMSLMPLVAIGTLVFVVWRRFQKLEAENERSESNAPRVPHEAPSSTQG